MAKNYYKKPQIKKISAKAFALTKRQQYSMDSLLLQTDNILLAQYSLSGSGSSVPGSER